jgi:hypothetical protein
MEKWRIYLILAGIVMIAYNIGNINFSDLGLSYTAIVGVVASIVFIISLIVYRKK